MSTPSGSLRRTGTRARSSSRASSSAYPSSAGPVSQKVAPSVSAIARPTSTFLRGIARVGCRISSSRPTPTAARAGSRASGQRSSEKPW